MKIQYCNGGLVRDLTFVFGSVNVLIQFFTTCRQGMSLFIERHWQLSVGKLKREAITSLPKHCIYRRTSVN